jgi:hypothetical protein
MQFNAPSDARPGRADVARGGRCPPTRSARGKGRRRAACPSQAPPCASADRPRSSDHGTPVFGGRERQRGIEIFTAADPGRGARGSCEIVEVEPARLRRAGAPGSMAISSKYSSGPSDRSRFHVPIAACWPPGASARPSAASTSAAPSRARWSKRRYGRASAWVSFPPAGCPHRLSAMAERRKRARDGRARPCGRGANGVSRGMTGTDDPKAALRRQAFDARKAAFAEASTACAAGDRASSGADRVRRGAGHRGLHADPDRNRPASGDGDAPRAWARGSACR